MKTVNGCLISYLALVLICHTPVATESDSTTPQNVASSSQPQKAPSPAAVVADKDGTNNTATAVTTTAPTPKLPVHATGTLSAEEYQGIREIQSYFYLTVEPIAIVLLSLSALAFLKDRQFASNCYLAALCLFDAWYMLMMLINFSCWKRPECFESHAYAQMSIWSLSYSGMATRRCYYMLNALVSFQRYVTIAAPWKLGCLRVLQKPCIPLVVVFLWSFSFHLYRPLQYKPIPIEGSGGSRWTRGYADRYRHHEDVFKTFDDMGRYLMVYLPMLICLISNCLMVHSLRKQKHERKKKDAACEECCSILNHPKDDITYRGIQPATLKRQVTVTILVSTFMMLIFNTPNSINETISINSDTYGLREKDHYLYLTLRSTFSIISQISDSLVTLSYLIISTAFRRRFIALFRPLHRLLLLLCCKPAPAAKPRPDVSETSLTVAPTLTQAAGPVELDAIPTTVAEGK